MAITLGLAAVSYRLVEHPIRVRSWSVGRVGGAAVAASAMTLVAVLVVPPQSGGFLVADQGLLDSAAIQPVENVTELEAGRAHPDDPARCPDEDSGRPCLIRSSRVQQRDRASGDVPPVTVPPVTAPLAPPSVRPAPAGAEPAGADPGGG